MENKFKVGDVVINNNSNHTYLITSVNGCYIYFNNEKSPNGKHYQFYKLKSNNNFIEIY